MELIRLKHEMDKKYRVMSLDEAFLEALSLSSGCANEVEEFGYSLYKQINGYNTEEEKELFLSIIKREYKESVIKGYGYKMDSHTWIEKVMIVDSSIEAYPLVVDSTFLVRMVEKIHSNEMDFVEGDLFDRIWSNNEYNYVLCEVNISDIDYEYFNIDEGLVDDYVEESIDTMPPIILEIPLSDDLKLLNKFPLIDGAHRCAKFKKLGLSKIQAYIPMPISD